MKQSSYEYFYTYKFGVDRRKHNGDKQLDHTKKEVDKMANVETEV